jgi:histidinol-phosphate aminotransferase
MSSFRLENIVRKNIRDLVPYSSARSEFEGKAKVFLDANENSLGSVAQENFSRYPDPLQKELKQKIGEIKHIGTEHIFVGNGSDEAIDLLIRAFCNPSIDNILICPPTYGMYQVCADINDVAVKKVLLTPAFGLDIEAIKKDTDEHTKLIFICSPNNPTGNLMCSSHITSLLEDFSGIVVIDEAYIDFADVARGQASLIHIPTWWYCKRCRKRGDWLHYGSALRSPQQRSLAF